MHDTETQKATLREGGGGNRPAQKQPKQLYNAYSDTVKIKGDDKTPK
jgi:hypothetical protein